MWDGGGWWAALVIATTASTYIIYIYIFIYIHTPYIYIYIYYLPLGPHGSLRGSHVVLTRCFGSKQRLTARL